MCQAAPVLGLKRDCLNAQENGQMGGSQVNMEASSLTVSEHVASDFHFISESLGGTAVGIQPR